MKSSYAIVAVVIVVVTLSASGCKLGLDSTAAISQSAFTCLLGQGYQFFVGRIQLNNGSFDDVGPQNIINARAANLTGLVDAYIEPCLESSCDTAENQAKNSLKHMTQKGAKIGRAWIRVLQIDNWANDTDTNQQFLTDMINGVRSTTAQVGILTSELDWNAILGDGYVQPALSAGGDNLLWWHNTTNGNRGYIGLNLNQIGGWRIPFMHQYQLNGSVPCNVGTANLTFNQDAS